MDKEKKILSKGSCNLQVKGEKREVIDVLLHTFLHMYIIYYVIYACIIYNFSICAVP